MPQLSTIASDVGKQTAKDKKLNKSLADSLFFSKLLEETSDDFTMGRVLLTNFHIHFTSKLM